MNLCLKTKSLIFSCFPQTTLIASILGGSEHSSAAILENLKLKSGNLANNQHASILVHGSERVKGIFFMQEFNSRLPSVFETFLSPAFATFLCKNDVCARPKVNGSRPNYKSYM